MGLDPKAMALEMAKALKPAWEDLKPGTPFPAGDTTDSQVIFQAVARGVLKYLLDHPAELVKVIRLTLPLVGPTECPVQRVDIDFTPT
jgi:hypothetical protein